MDAAELRDDDLHDKRMDRLKREREEKEAMKAEIERLEGVKRRTLAIADERAIEVVKARADNERLRAALIEIRDGFRTQPDWTALSAIRRYAADAINR